jgi:hypothetical protein
VDIDPPSATVNIVAIRAIVTVVIMAVVTVAITVAIIRAITDRITTMATTGITIVRNTGRMSAGITSSPCRTTESNSSALAAGLA